MSLDLQTLLETYGQRGWLHLPGMFSPAQATAMRTQVDELRAWPAQKGSVWHYADEEARARGEHILSRIERFRPYHAGLRAVLEDPGILSVLTALFAEPALLFKDKVNFKLPGSSGFALHQDAQAGWGAYGAVHLTVMISIDDSTHENGCLELALGPRQTGLRGPLFAPLSERDLPDLSFAPLPTRAGDVLVFDSFVPHRSAPNRTHSARRALYATYNPRSQGDCYERYFQDKYRNYPPDVEREPDRTYRYRV